MAEEDEKKMGLNPFELGILTSRVQGVVERLDRFEGSVSRQMGEFKIQLTEFGGELRKLAEGYVRREEFTQYKMDSQRSSEKLERDINAIAEMVRAATVKSAGDDPYIGMLKEIIKWAVIIGIALYTGHELPRIGG